MQEAVGQLISSPATTASLTILGIGVVALWLAAAWWTYQDMQRRSDSELAALVAAAWVLLSSPALLPLSLPVYLLGRPQRTVSQARSSELALALQAELLDGLQCPGCGLAGDGDWRRCPTCATWLAVECEGCRRWSSNRLDVCPWCAVERPALGSAGGFIGLPAMEPAGEPVGPVAQPVAEPAGRRVEGARRQVPAPLG